MEFLNNNQEHNHISRGEERMRGRYVFQQLLKEYHSYIPYIKFSVLCLVTVLTSCYVTDLFCADGAESIMGEIDKTTSTIHDIGMKAITIPALLGVFGAVGVALYQRSFNTMIITIAIICSVLAVLGVALDYIVSLAGGK